MPNWCYTDYVIEGEKKEIDALEKMMNELSAMEKPYVENGFGNNWLGCIVEKLGGDWRKIRCRGDWNELRKENGTLRFNTETAWGSCNGVLNLICEHFPSLSYFFIAEEPGDELYITNDTDGKYFPERYYIDLCTLEGAYDGDYFTEIEDVYKWLNNRFGVNVKSVEDIECLDDKWRSINDDAYVNLHEYTVII